ncbi:MAG: hypothetical protein U5Q44_10210 [Dehalococcoidia bacterium]|nr:hypothetical protein [Dehalococcoidia bacterium]
MNTSTPAIPAPPWTIPHPDCYQFWFADTGFFVFDLRGERDYRNGRVVSDHQWKQFDEFLREASHRDVKTIFVVTSVPLVHFSPALVRMVDWIPARHGENARDRWDARDVQEERDRLEHRLFEWQAAGTRRQSIVISGDVHSGAAFTVTHKNGPGRFHQWTSSALTSPGGPVHAMGSTVGTRLVNVGEDDSHAERKGLLGSNNFGLVRVRPLDEGGHLITFRAFPYRARFHRLGHARKAIAVPPEA